MDVICKLLFDLLIMPLSRKAASFDYLPIIVGTRRRRRAASFEHWQLAPRGIIIKQIFTLSLAAFIKSGYSCTYLS